MTEKEWVESSDSAAMLDFLIGRSTDRKLRLFCIACCYQNCDQFTDLRERRILQVAEEMAAGIATEQDCKAALDLWLDLYDEEEDEFTIHVPVDVVCPKVDAIDATRCARAMAWGPDYSVNGFEGLEDELRYEQATFLRDIFGNPFRPVTFDPRWRTSDVVGLARAIYDDKAFERMPILADALMDAGCEEEQIIDHCRGDGPHVRGCWIVDLILEKV